MPGGARDRVSRRRAQSDDQDLENALCGLRSSFAMMRSAKVASPPDLLPHAAAAPLPLLPLPPPPQAAAAHPGDMSSAARPRSGSSQSGSTDATCLNLCEAALRVQEDAVGLMPALVEREREAAAAARVRASDAAERAAALQGELEERERTDRRMAHEMELARRRAQETEERCVGRLAHCSLLVSRPCLLPCQHMPVPTAVAPSPPLRARRLPPRHNPQVAVPLRALVSSRAAFSGCTASRRRACRSRSGWPPS